MKIQKSSIQGPVNAPDLYCHSKLQQTALSFLLCITEPFLFPGLQHHWADCSYSELCYTARAPACHFLRMAALPIYLGEKYEGHPCFLNIFSVTIKVLLRMTYNTVMKPADFKNEITLVVMKTKFS